MQTVAAAIQELHTKIRGTLERAKNSYLHNKDQFFSNEYSILGKTISHYAACFKSLGVKSNSEFKSLLGQNFAHSNVRIAVEELETVHEDWAQFLNENEDYLNKMVRSGAEKLIKVGDILCLDQILIDARTEQ